MRKWFALVLLLAFSWMGGLGQDARAGVTIDVLFQDGTGHALTIPEGDPGPGCTFASYYIVFTGRCMDVMLTTTDPLFVVGTFVAYDSDNGLAVSSFHEWGGVGTGDVLKPCTPSDGLSDDGARIGQFDCWIFPPPVGPPSVAPGTYRLGTIVWDPSSTTPGTETISIVGSIVGAIINGNILDVSSTVVQGSAVLNIIPEPGTAALLGLGLAGLVIAARRGRG